MKGAWREGLGGSALGGVALFLYQTSYRGRYDRAREQLVVRLATPFPPESTMTLCFACRIPL